MVADLHPLTHLAESGVSLKAAAGRHVLPTHSRSSYQGLSRAERESQFEREYGSLWTPGMLDRLSLPLSRIHE